MGAGGQKCLTSVCDEQRTNSSCDLAMNTWLLWGATFTILKAGHTDPGVIQTPSHQVTKIGQGVTLRCDPVSNHLYFYWYRQILGQKMDFLVSFYNDKLSEKSEIFSDRFSIERPDGSYLILKIQPTQLGDSAVYLCASSLATAWQKHCQPVHKLSGVCLSPSYQHPSLPREGCILTAVSK
uniref:Ig-like domain-containing protein n=1 Tax=Oryctolagus cuniculus TaxID=9986 RepID=A0A0B4J1Q1_RABIT